MQFLDTIPKIDWKARQMLRLLFLSFVLSLSLLYADAQSDYNKGLNFYNKKEYAKAFQLYKSLAEQGHSMSQYSLGVLYTEGHGVTQDFNEAVRWYTKAAEQGNASAQYNLGLMHANAQGVEQDYREAIRWFTKAGEQNVSDAQYNLGIMYTKGQGVGQDYHEAIQWFTKAGEQGHVSAQFNLGVIYRTGKGVTQNYSEAVRWYTKAAEQGEPSSQLYLGLLYAKGHGVAQDYRETVRWYTKAAEQGNVSAQYLLGAMYLEGQKVVQDYRGAVLWFTNAAEQGNANAQLNLGMMYESGQGVPVSNIIAYALYNLSTATDPSSENNALRKRNNTIETMTNQEIETAQTLTRNMQTNGISKAISLYLKNQPKSTSKKSVSEATPKASSSSYPERPAKIPGKTSCNTRCFNGDCYRTYDNGKQKHFQVSPTYNPLNSQWEFDAGPC